MTLFGTLGRRAVFSLPTFARAPRLSDMVAVARQRRALRRLDERALIDLGLTRNLAHLEASRPAWDVPANWRG